MNDDLVHVAGVVFLLLGVGALVAVLAGVWAHKSRDKRHRKIARAGRGSSTRVELTASASDPRRSRGGKRRRRRESRPKIDLFAEHDEPESPNP